MSVTTTGVFRPLRIALCSPGLTRQTEDSMTLGLDFLARLIHQKHPEIEFFTVHERDVMSLGYGDVDFLLVSFVGSGSALAYARAVRYQKPPVFTAFGGPAMLFPAAFRAMADVIMVGRGEDAIFRMLEGDYAGMMTRDSALDDDSVHICETSLLSPGQCSVGCKFRCGFCSYAWMHTYASSMSEWDATYSSNLRTPNIELMLKDLRFGMLSQNPWKRVITGLDVLTPLDIRLVRKPTSMALVRSVMRRMADEARAAFIGRYQLKLYTITGYPWNDNPCDLSYLRDAVAGVEFPEGVSLMIDLTLNHFIPQICTPLECCAVRLDDMRARFTDYREPTWPTTGAFIHIDKRLIPTPMQAVQQAVLMRTDDPGVVPHVATAKSAEALAEMYPQHVDWQDSKPAPWIRRNNDVSARVRRFYEDLYRYSPLRPPMPVGYTPFESRPEIYGLPVADFGKSTKKRPAGVSNRLRGLL